MNGRAVKPATLENDALRAALVARFAAGRPVIFTPDEAAHVREALRGAMAVTLSCSPADIGDEARVFDALGLDSIDVFDMLDQLGEIYEVQVALEELPTDLFRGADDLTFADFAQGILEYFRSPPVSPAQGDAPQG